MSYRFNSAFFASIGSNDYSVILATEEFIQPDLVVTARAAPATWDPYDELIGAREQVYHEYHSNPASFQRLSNEDCMNVYNTDFITNRRSVVVLTEDGMNLPANSEGESIVFLAAASAEFRPAGGGQGQNAWTCSTTRVHQESNGTISVDWAANFLPTESQFCPDTIKTGKYLGDGWRPGNTTAEGCLSQQTEEQCGFYGNVAIIFIVVACNLAKVVIMAYMVFGRVISHPLMTLGDAVSSFVADPDTASLNLCPMSIELIKTKKTKKDHYPLVQEAKQVEQRLTTPLQSVRKTNEPLWKPPSKPIRFRSAASARRWSWTAVYLVCCLLAIATLLFYALHVADAYTGASDRLPRSRSLSALWALGLGTIMNDHLITGWDLEYFQVQNAVVAAVLVANSPQLALSFLYFALNTLVTLMASSREWLRFSVVTANKRGPRTLRTSAPEGAQHRTYFLSLPFRFAVPMIVLSALLHWLISQSIFLAVVGKYNADGSLFAPFVLATCGYSPIGMVLVLIVGCIMFLVLAVAGFMPMTKGMPIVGSCSLAIAANCRVNWEAEMFGGLDPVRMGEEARLDMVRGPMVWGELVDDAERLQFDRGSWKGQDNGGRPPPVPPKDDQPPVYGFVSAAKEDWRERVRAPLPRDNVTSTISGGRSSVGYEQIEHSA